MEVLRTPDHRFTSLPGWSFAPRYIDVGDGLRMHYVDEGPPAGAPILMLHGEPTWSYVYRRMIPPLAAAGLRVIAADLIGFGRSDKPAARADYTFQRHVKWVAALIEALDLRDVTLVGQDWGGALGLRVAAENQSRFARLFLANTLLLTGDEPAPEPFLKWRRRSQEMPEFPVGAIVASGCRTPLAPEVVAAYDAPFPDDRYKAGARQFPILMPTSPHDPATAANRAAWDVLRRWTKHMLTAFSDGDPITRGADKLFQQAIPGAAGHAHATIRGAGHFLQEDRSEELARLVAEFISTSERRSSQSHRRDRRRC